MFVDPANGEVEDFLLTAKQELVLRINAMQLLLNAMWHICAKSAIKRYALPMLKCTVVGYTVE